MSRAHLFPHARALVAASLVFEGDGRPALYLCAETRAGLPKLYRVPDGCAVKVHVPHPLPPTKDGGVRVFLPAASRATFETLQGNSAVLSLHSVRVCCELLEALQALEDARQVGKGKAA